MDTNIQNLEELNKYYDELKHTRGIVSMEEIYLINDKLQLDNMDIPDLRNLRDFIVCHFSTQDKEFKELDKMSAYVAVIDNKIWNKGGEI